MFFLSFKQLGYMVVKCDTDILEIYVIILI
jgi:hypothetical protein